MIGQMLRGEKHPEPGRGLCVPVFLAFPPIHQKLAGSKRKPFGPPWVVLGVLTSFCEWVSLLLMLNFVSLLLS